MSSYKILKAEKLDFPNRQNLHYGEFKKLYEYCGLNPNRYLTVEIEEVNPATLKSIKIMNLVNKIIIFHDNIMLKDEF
ncbi:MAG: hypothetical protein ACOC1X_03030 [Promethearchaeota archaeon]